MKTSDAPEPMEAGRSVVYKDLIFFAPFGEEKIHECSLLTRGTRLEPEIFWRTFKTKECRNSGLAIIKMQVTTIGGWKNNTYTKEVWTRNNDDWYRLPDMDNKRSDPGVVTNDNYVTVISGKGPKEYEANWKTCVEVYDVNKGSWNSVCSLPSPFSGIEVTLCKGTVYVFPDRFGTACKCSLDALVSSAKNQEESVWKTFSNIPVRFSSPTTLDDHVVCVGGVGTDSSGSKDISVYNEHSNSWDVIGCLQVGRMYSMVEVCQNKVVVVGGVRELTDERNPADCLKEVEIYVQT